MGRVKDYANRVEEGERVELFVEEVGRVVNELFRRNSLVHVEVYATEWVTWIQRISEEGRCTHGKD